MLLDGQIYMVIITELSQFCSYVILFFLFLIIRNRAHIAESRFQPQF